MRKIVSKGIVGIALFAGLLAVTPSMAKVSAAEGAQSYTLKDETQSFNQEFEIKGGSTKKITLDVKEDGILHAAIGKTNILGSKETVTVEVLDEKQNSVVKETITKTKDVYISKSLKKGTYTIKLSNNLKQGSNRWITFNYTFNDRYECKADGTTVYNIANTNNNSYYTFYNDKSQVVSIHAAAKSYQDDPTYSMTMTITDQNGKSVVKKKISVEDDTPGTSEYYLPKGTYTIKCKYSVEDVNFIKITAGDSSASKLKVNATSKKKAASYEGKSFSMAYTSSTGSAKKQWVKIDTSKKAYGFHIEAGDIYERNNSVEKTKVTLYNSKGKKIESASLNHGLVKTGSTAEDYHYFYLKKNSGVYYLAIEAAPNHVVRVKKDTITAKAAYNGKTSYVVKKDSAYQVKSSSKRNITSTIKVYKTAYMNFSMKGTTGLTLYNSKGKKVSTYNGTCYKLAPGSYTLKAKAKKAKTNYDLQIKMINVNAMSNVAETKNKKAEFTLKGIKGNSYCNIDLGATVDFTGGIKKVTVYGPDNKRILTEKDSFITFKTKTSGTYRVVVETKKNGAFDYRVMNG